MLSNNIHGHVAFLATLPFEEWNYICELNYFNSTVSVCDLWTAPTVIVNEYLNCDRQKSERN
jgi:hypothetical protein